MRIISVENLAKRYRIGAKEQPQKSFRELITDGFTAPIRNLKRLRRLTKFDKNDLSNSNQIAGSRGGKSNGEDIIWALKGVSFEVGEGEILGIIGRNGAGKSTLLKVLSRITEPTAGDVKIYGRISSLLEVGTGFQPELTGRDNIFLNGAILGMRKEEIKKKFDEIVAFAETEKFIDTPVKYYSSGMYVRLAFAVAAHLEPEILVVDEVLAVGDAAFQKKCLGKMGDVAREGRTILFVSHNLGAVKALCGRTLWLTDGRVAMDGSTTEVTAAYMASFESYAKAKLEERMDREGNGRFQFTRLHFLNRHGQEVHQITSGDELMIRLDYKTTERVDEKRIIIIVSFRDDEDRPVSSFFSDEIGAVFAPFQPAGTVELSIPNFLIRAGHYTVSLFARNGTESEDDLYDRVYHATSLDVIAGDVWKSGCTSRPGPYTLIPASMHN